MFGIPPSEKSLMWKLNNFKRENLLGLIEQGHIQSTKLGKNEIPKPIPRPIFDNLYSFKYKWDPHRYKNANYQKFLEQIRQKPAVPDLHSLKIDEFARNIQLIENPPDFGQMVMDYENNNVGTSLAEVFDD